MLKQDEKSSRGSSENVASEGSEHQSAPGSASELGEGSDEEAATEGSGLRSGSESEGSSGTPTYGALVKARKDLRDKRTALLTEEMNLRQHRQDRYYWNKVAKAATSSGNIRAGRASQASDTVPIWNWPMAEDSTRYLDISKLQAQTAQHPDKVIVFAGTDYGIRRMSETVAQTYNEIQAHINRYWVLCCKSIRGSTGSIGCMLDHVQRQGTNITYLSSNDRNGTTQPMMMETTRTSTRTSPLRMMTESRSKET